MLFFLCFSWNLFPWEILCFVLFCLYVCSWLHKEPLVGNMLISYGRTTLWILSSSTEHRGKVTWTSLNIFAAVPSAWSPQNPLGICLKTRCSPKDTMNLSFCLLFSSDRLPSEDILLTSGTWADARLPSLMFFCFAKGPQLVVFFETKNTTKYLLFILCTSK